MNLILITVFAASTCLANGQSSCRTPSGGDGECIDIYSCQPLLDLIKMPDRTEREVVDLLKKSICGDTVNERKVCCPKTSPPSLEETTCYTPEGDIGKCVSLTSCPHLADNLKVTAYVEKSKSRCEHVGQDSLCCGPKTDCTKVSAFPPDPRSQCCGVDSKFANKIYGGTETTVDQYPWLVMMEYVQLGVTKLLCGGNLISGKYVLTAGNCVKGSVLNLGTPEIVRLGDYDISHEGPDCTTVEGGGEDCTEGVIRIPIEKILPHPKFNPNKADKSNDIALIRMKEYAPYTDFIRPICLPTLDLTLPQNIPRSFELFTAGWGAVNSTQLNSTVKRHVYVPYIDLKKCQAIYSEPGRRITLSKGQMCAGGAQGKDTCKGDTGMALMYKAGSIHEIIGIVSYGPNPCGLEGIPGVYTKVYEYLDWIKDYIVP